MHWILQNNLFNEAAYQTLLDTLERQGLPYSIHKVIPLIGKLTEPRAPHVKGPVICMGSYSLRHAAKKHRWVPGVFDLEPFDFRVQAEHWGQHMLNHGAVVSRFADVKWERVSPCSAHRLEVQDCAACQAGYPLEEAFIRPIHDSKVFAGKLFTQEEFETWQHKVCVLGEDYGNTLGPNTLVQYCWPHKIYAEYRFWIVKGEIVCASLYKRGDKVFYSDDVAPHVFDYVRARIAEWQPLEAFVIDVCEVPNLDAIRWSHGDQEGVPWLKIVEINTLNSSGFYACNIPKLVNALETAFGVDDKRKSNEER